jgi:hypothetical protein
MRRIDGTKASARIPGEICSSGGDVKEPRKAVPRESGQELPGCHLAGGGGEKAKSFVKYPGPMAFIFPIHIKILDWATGVRVRVSPGPSIVVGSASLSRWRPTFLGLLFGVAYPLCGLQPAAVQADMSKDINLLREKYAATFDRANRLTYQGYVDSANRELRAIADKERSPAARLMVGNLLYALDPEASYALHRDAYAAVPKDPSSTLEWAMERHRRGEIQEALPLYRYYLKRKPKDESVNALVAECFLRMGDLRGAVEAWRKARHSHNHTGIDLAIFAIHGDPPFWRQRSDLLKRVNAGDLSVAESLIATDIEGRLDWWNAEDDPYLVNADLQTLRDALGDTPRYRQMQCWVRIQKPRHRSEGVLEQELREAKVLLDQTVLPESSKVASDLIRKAVPAGLLNKESLRRQFGKELRRRAHSELRDVDALDLLWYLSDDGKSGAELDTLDRWGWDQYADARFAASYLSGLREKKALRGNNPDLRRAVEQFPDDSRILAFAIDTALQEKKLDQPLLVQTIKAEFRRLSNGTGGKPDSYTLARLFNLLEKEMKGH